MAHDQSYSATLYSSPISDCAARLRIALNLKIPCNQINIDLKDQQNQQPTYSNLNPSQTIPTLLHNGVTITQSLAVLEYLDETFSDVNPILPPDLVTRTKIRSLMSIIATDMHPLLTHRVGRKFEETLPVDYVRGWRLHWIQRGLANFETEVAKMAGEYCVGDSISLVDICLVPALWTAERWGINLDQYSTIAKISRRLNEVEEFRSGRQNLSSELIN